MGALPALPLYPNHMKTLLRACTLALALLLSATAAAQSYTFTTIVGLPPQAGSADGVGSNARFNLPYATAVDGFGNVYVADRNNHVIRKINSAGVVSTLAGLASVTGNADGTGSAARFNLPSGVAVDGTGNLYVADNTNHAIRKITSDGVVTTFAGLAGTTGSADGTGSTARFNFPVGVAIDTDGGLYVSDRSNRTIRKITSAGVVSTVAGLATVTGNTDGAGSNARFNLPSGIALDGAGNLIIADTSNHTIRKMTPAGVVTTVAGTAGISGNTNAVGAAARFNLPNGVAVDSAGNILVADTSNEAIRKIAPDGTVTTYAGSRNVPGSADGTGTNARFFRPNGITLDTAGNAYVADGLNQLIRKITAAGVTTTIAGLGAALGSFGAVDGTGNGARFNSPRGLAMDSSGNLFVADSQNFTIRKITPAGAVSTFSGLAGTTGFNDGTGAAARFGVPYGLACDSSDRLYVTDTSNHVVRTITPAGVVSTIAGLAGTLGSTDGTATAARLNFPQGLSTDRDGNSFVADTANHTIRKVTPTGVVTTLAGAPGVSGSTDGVGSAARFNLPYSTAVDSAGNVYVADAGNSTVRKITSDGTVTTLAGLAGSTGSADANGANARFNTPEGLVLDGAGNLYVADTNNHAVRKLTPAGAVTTLGGQTGQFGSRDGTGTNALFGWPAALVLDAAGAIYVLDNGNNAIVKGVLDSAPAIIVQPQPLTVTLGTRVTLSVAATGGGLSYQWSFNGFPITGATGTSYTVASAQNSNIGGYTVAVSNSAGALVSSAATLNVITTTNPGRLINLSILAPLVVGETMTMGTALGGTGTSGTKALIARAVGPSLSVFGLANVLPDPKMAVVSIATGSTIATNNDWGGDVTLGNAFAQVGAFPYASPDSKDAGVYQTALAPGNYTVQISDNGTGTGSVIAELYDATPGNAFGPTTPRLINVSVLKQISAGTTLTAGFVIGGATAKTVLVRAIGPTLGQAPFNISGVMADPKLELFNNSTGVKIAENNDWGGDPALAAAATSVGAFALASATTKDAVLLVTLAPGQYSARVSGADGGGGTAIVEVYEVP
jgi:sugar lactone lactonase YvrE